MADGHDERRLVVRPMARKGRQRQHRAEHEDVAVGEVDQLDDAVDEGVAQRDEGVDQAVREPDDDRLDECVIETMSGATPQGGRSRDVSWFAGWTTPGFGGRIETKAGPGGPPSLR